VSIGIGVALELGPIMTVKWKLSFRTALLLGAILGYSGNSIAQDNDLAKAENLLRSGQSSEAIALFKSITSGQAYSASERARAFGGLGLAETSLGNKDRAISAFENSIDLADDTGQADLALKSRYNHTLLEIEGEGDFSFQSPWFAQTRGASKNLSKRSVFFVEDEEQKIEALISGLIEIAADAEEIGDVTTASRAYATAARTSVSIGQDQATDYAISSLSALDNVQKDRSIVEASLYASEIAIAISSLSSVSEESEKDNLLEASSRALQSSVEYASSKSDARLESYGLGLLGRVYALNGQGEDALVLTSKAAELAELSSAREILFVWQGQQAGILERQGKTGAALNLYEQSSKSIQQVRPKLAKSFSGGKSSRELVEPILLAYAEVLMKAKDPEALWRARNIIEQVRTIEFEQYFDEACVAEQSGSQLEVDNVDQNSVTIYPVQFDDRLELIVSKASETRTENSIKRITVDIDRDTINETLEIARNELIEDDGSQGPIGELSMIYDWIIRPVQAELTEQTDTIVFAPDGLLRGIPIAALYDDQTERFLIEDYAIVYTLGLSIAAPQSFAEVPHLAIYAGVGEALEIPGGPGWDALPGAQGEISKISQILPGKSLINQSFTKEGLRKALSSRRFSTLHLATHATFGSSAADSYLLAHSGQAGVGDRISLSELEDYTSQARIKGDAIELLTLSACETGSGNSSGESEDALLGLAGVAYKAGARSVLASLWKVYDDSTEDLMVSFYENLLIDNSEDRGQSGKAQALRQAQLELLKKQGSQHPARWSSFILFGNWL
jgi:CHAT domain-containing protein